MNKKTDKRGFTIIEVLVVIAVAAVILIAIFFSIRAAQRSSRDHARKEGAQQLVSALENYNSQHLNNFSDFDCGQDQDCQDIGDPDSATGHPVSGTPGVSATQHSGITYVIGAGCGTDADAGKAVTSPLGDRTYAVLYWTEADQLSHCISAQGEMTSNTSSASGGGGGGGGAGWSAKGSQYTQCIPSSDRCLSYSGGATYTAWAPTQFGYDVTDLGTGTVTITIYYKNTGPLPSTYPYFNVNVYINGAKTLSNLHLPVNTDGSAPGPFVKSFTVSVQPTSFNVEWTNDWCCGTSDTGAREDANFVLIKASLEQ